MVYDAFLGKKKSSQRVIKKKDNKVKSFCARILKHRATLLYDNTVNCILLCCQRRSDSFGNGFNNIPKSLNIEANLN